MHERTCGTCRYWGALSRYRDRTPGFGKCRRAELATDDNPALDQAVLFCVVDDEEHFAELRTRSTFNCNQWEKIVCTNDAT